MRSIRLKCLMAAAAAVFSGGAAASEAVRVPDLSESPVYVRTDGLPTALARRVEAEAQKGLRPLRQYVQRTRFLHQLDLVSLLVTRDQARALVAGDGTAKLTLIARN
ncbi:MAG: hypothetical protein ACXWG1_05570 [Usitatibacter sp.]